MAHGSMGQAAPGTHSSSSMIPTATPGPFRRNLSEVHDHDVRRPGQHDGDQVAGLDQRDDPVHAHAQRGSLERGRAGRCTRSRRRQPGEDGRDQKRNAGRHRWAVRRVEGIAGGLLDRRRRERGSRDRDRLARRRVHRVPGRSASGHGPVTRVVRTDSGIEGLLRDLAPRVLGALARRHGQFDACEDAVQESLLAAALQWAETGVPDNPRWWLLTVASRRLVDEWRSESARRRREETDAVLELPTQGQASSEDDTLTLLFLCCHPSLSIPSQLALTLRAVGGLSTAEVANAFLVPEATMAQRISRAKQSIRNSDIPFVLPPQPERADRLRVVLQVLYL